MANEEKHFSEGVDSPIFEVKGWKIKPLICYDLRFPVWSRNKNMSYDLILFVANWPEARITAWDTLLKARAIENLCYSVGVNRIGEDANDLSYIGHTQGIDMLGEQMSVSDKADEGVVNLVLDKSKLDSIRAKFQFLNDKDSFSIEK